jgi:hypothetical protein
LRCRYRRLLLHGVKDPKCALQAGAAILLRPPPTPYPLATTRRKQNSV